MPVIWDCDNKTPSAAVTFVGGSNNDANNPILFVNQKMSPSYCEEQEQKYNLHIDPDNHWIISKVEVRVQTDWSVSTATFVLVPSSPNVAKLPPLPDVSALRGGVKKTLDKEDEIRIFLGWRSNTEESISKEMFTEVPFDVPLAPETKEASLIEYDSSKKMSPVFWGFIDKIELMDNGNGPQLVFSCRDRMRVLADTRLLAIPELRAELIVSEDSIQFSSASGEKGERDVLIYEIIRAVNYSGQQNYQVWRPFIKGITARRYKYNAEGERINTDNVIVEAGSLVQPEALVDQSQWNRIAQFLPVESSFNPRVHIWTERPPFINGVRQATLQVLNRTPLEILDHIALQEELPIDFRVSPFNGDFVFGPRTIDFTGFEDPVRSYRSYFYKSAPAGITPAPNQQVMKIEALSTSFGTFNQFIMIDNNTNGSQKNFLSSIQLALRVDNNSTQGRSIVPPNRTQIISDGSISSYPDPLVGATLVGFNAAKRFNRDVEGVEIQVLGDPTFYLNEAFSVYNTVLHDHDSIRVNDNKQYQDFFAGVRSSIDELVSEQVQETVKQQKKQGIIPEVETISTVAAALLNPNDENSLSLTDSDSGKYPIYRAVNIAHTLNERSFTTSIIGISDY